MLVASEDNSSLIKLADIDSETLAPRRGAPSIDSALILTPEIQSLTPRMQSLVGTMLRALHCFVHVPRRTEPGSQAQLMSRSFVV